MKTKPFSLIQLANVLLDYHNDDFTLMKDVSFDFSNAVVLVSGIMQSEWETERGDWMIPPTHTLVCRWASIDRVLLSCDNEDARCLTDEELTDLETLLYL